MTTAATYSLNLDWRLDKRKLGFALTASLFVHVLLILLIQFTDDGKPIIEKNPPRIMDVVLLDESANLSKHENKDAKVIAQQNSEGKQREAQDKINRAARSPAAVQSQPNQNKPQPQAPQMPSTPPIPTPQEKTNSRIISRKSDDDAQLLPQDNDYKEDKKPTNKPVPVIPLANLLPSSSALTQLSRDFDRERRMEQFLSKEADIGINTRESKYAPYAQGLVRSLEEQWRPKDLIIAELSPNERKVLMRVSIGLSGELLDIKILRPSPSPELNDSAAQAVYKAAPFNPLPSTWGLERANFFFMFEVVEDGATFRTFR
ncbi:MAG: TonB family protein [Ghiorsea sp.]|nr:TonB family protein [Ghiorsea sp.]MDQ7059179.1 TonB family protein [Ghiorsea sp.]